MVASQQDNYCLAIVLPFQEVTYILDLSPN